MSNLMVKPNRNSKLALARHNLSDPDQDNSAAELSGVLCFTLGTDEFAVDLNLIRQIVKPPPLTWVPKAEPCILGVVSIRGEVVTLIDLRQLLGFEPSSWPRTARILIVERSGELLALLVDNVTQVRRVVEAELESSDSLEGLELSAYMLCVFRTTPTHAVVVVDLDTLLAEKIR